MCQALVEDLKERGNLAMKRGDMVAARAFYSEALQVPGVPDQVRAALLGNRTACLLALGHSSLALTDAEAAVELVPGWVKGHFRLSSARERLGDLAGALVAVQKAHELEPTNSEILAKLRLLEVQVGTLGGEAAAPAQLDQSEEQAEPLGDSRKSEADSAFLAGDVARAIQLYNALIADHPHNVRLLACRAASHLKAGNMAQVEEDVDTALELGEASGRLIPLRMHLKLLLRRAEARLCSGR